MTGDSGRTLKLTIAYDGTGFHGWQLQAGQPTVQGSVLEAIRRICPDVEELPGASRTDSGVHALGQCASFRTASTIPLERLRPALNGSLPRDIRIRSVEEAPPGFHARHSARGKLYRYWVDRAADSSPFTSRYALHVPDPLDVEAMQRAAQAFVGEHDFASYQCISKGPERSTVRTIDSVRVEEAGSLLDVSVAGRSFLYRMVRAMVGTLLEVGRGKWEPARVAESIAARSRSTAGPTAPPYGLFLVAVAYSLPVPLEAEAGRPMFELRGSMEARTGVPSIDLEGPGGYHARHL